jgi:hypothetical protein
MSEQKGKSIVQSRISRKLFLLYCINASTDGEEELYRALKFTFPYAVHLRCFIHFRENCKAQLKQSNIPQAEQKKFLADIFGRRVGDTWENGMQILYFRQHLYRSKFVSANYSTVIGIKCTPSN